jgi:hypothetical protein
MLLFERWGYSLSRGGHSLMAFSQVLGVSVVLLAGNQISALRAVLKLASCLGQNPAIKFLQVPFQY